MSTDSSQVVLETLISRGWRFRDPDGIISLIQSKNLSSSLLVDSIESELLNMDLRFFGGKSLPELSASKKSSYLYGPKVLQLVSVRDIHQSIIDCSSKSLQQRHRLLKLVLTDGLSETVAIEYNPIPSITEEIIPGCKVRLENKVAVHYGILCLSTGAVSILGGLVQSLYDEWQMSRKCSGVSRSLVRPSYNDDGSGPPPFEKLQADDICAAKTQFHSSHVGHNGSHQWGGDKDQHFQITMGRGKAFDIETGEKPSSIETRPKEAIEAVPVQNQAASQKLLQKMMSGAMHGERNLNKSHKTRLKGKQEEVPVFTLDEWERRKASSSKARAQDISGDEELARQLQSQLDVQDYQKHRGNVGEEADEIRMSMFNFGGSDGRLNEERARFRGRGKGRGRAGRGRKIIG